ncbi:outer membrane receptor protein involved in Fe transport [Anseongella ginsenosidimutans]|uniref:Outer membrane receptor protein involved in Fe transport n=1 Tax=Anseongella ginsenosidimutans TaxID=496056 RepID=A0A4R3L1U6_9SPHI|nr:TonB-dependent receptor [Anseongella ginsenosidimutans]QEC50955.1 TonB-dependent receptor [Anseongella ginsenosidimutans]TCS90402.1 outer membrane receptor protein involved in Fe transport [Anseongella ginsenosidimutans]
MKRICKQLALAAFLTAVSSSEVSAQDETVVSGHVLDAETAAPLQDVSVIVKGRPLGTTTGGNGEFELTADITPPFTLVFSHIGYTLKEVTVQGNRTGMEITLQATSILGREIVVAASRMEENILESPVSIEKMNAAAIRAVAAPGFYDALPHLKGVESSIQSLTFRSVSTRGFNSNGNTRFNQFIDGMDNQAPGLNFSVGNMIGMTELDAGSVELLPGAASALYGAGGINGTLLMNSKSPFDYQGLSLQLKAGLNHVGKEQRSSAGFIPDLAFRYARAMGKFAFKINAAYLQANDWEAENYTNFDRLNVQAKPGASHADDPNYDGVNSYGDEINTNIRQVAQQMAAMSLIPGAAVALVPDQLVSRTGYREENLVDYATRNLKLGGALHYRFTSELEGILQVNRGSGTSVYTGADRYSLRDFIMTQYKAELRGRNFFLRAYTTQERSGDSYNATALGSILNETWKPSQQWFPEYVGAFLTAKGAGADDMQAHAAARAFADQERYEPGSGEFEQAKEEITSRYIGFGADRNGAKFNDKTNLYHYEGMYNFSGHIRVVELLAGASYRRYALRSDGTIFDDADRDIGISEYGAYLQVSKKVLEERLKFTGSLRYDKNENFEGRFTPRLSAVVTVTPENNIRLSWQTGFRNPTTQNQYIDLLVRANTRLIGGLPELLGKYNLYENKGYTQESVQRFQQSGNPADLEQYTFRSFKPERVQAYEIGYRGLINKKLLVDAYYYYNIYNDFISALVLLQSPDGTPMELGNASIFSTVVNNPSDVVTQGWALGLDYSLRGWRLGGNVSFNTITEKAEGLYNDFNTPKYRFNLNLGRQNLYRNIGFRLAYRWQDTFHWNSTFSAGEVPAFGALDAQVNYTVPETDVTVKLGGSNIFNRYYFTSFGNPAVGAVYYLSLTYDSVF